MLSPHSPSMVPSHLFPHHVYTGMFSSLILKCFYAPPLNLCLDTRKVGGSPLFSGFPRMPPLGCLGHSYYKDLILALSVHGKLMRASAWQAAKNVAEGGKAAGRRDPAKPVEDSQNPRNPARPAKPCGLSDNTGAEVRLAPLARQHRDISGLRTLLMYRQRPGDVYACRIAMA